ncbi:MAG: hypothetical protein ACHQ50_08780 [Fimbriimonadales bacterium]
MKWLLIAISGWVLFGPGSCVTPSQNPLYTAVILPPKESKYHARATAIADGREFGYGNGTGTGTSTAGSIDESALAWQASPGSDPKLSVVEDGDSRLYGASGDSEVGEWHYTAALWKPGIPDRINLTPPSSFGAAYGVYGSVQVGNVHLDYREAPHAYMWKGNVATAIDLNPQGYTQSTAWAVSGDTQVGEGTKADTGLTHALMWHGSAESSVDLNPVAFMSSSSYGASGSYEVGCGARAATGGLNHALLWHGSPSCVDLNPAGFASSEARAAAGKFQVGFGTASKYSHALLWEGDAGSYLDLHQFLESVRVDGKTMDSSAATAVDTQGNVVGYAYIKDRPYDEIAILWRRNRP